MRPKKTLAAALIAVGLLASAAAAHAAPVLGSHVDSSTWTSAIGGTSGWAYMGQSVSAFTGPGTGDLELRSSGFADSFGYAMTNHTNKTAVFGSGAAPGAISAITGFAPSYLFYFSADASGLFGPLFDNTQFTDGFATGGAVGATDGDIDIFFNAGQSEWAFFFDDSGPISLSPDDNDYNDLVVTFRQAGVPEPTTLSLIGLGLLGLGAARRRKTMSV